VSDYFDRIERQIVRRVEAGVPRGSRSRPRLDLVVPALSVVVVAAIAVVFLSVHGERRSAGAVRQASSGSPGSRARGGVELVYQAEPTPQTPVVTRAALARAIDVMRARAAAFGMSAASLRSTGAEITVRLPGFTNLARAEQGLGATALLEFYDWEANALTPNGQTVVVSQNQTQDPAAITVSQGSGSAAPGEPGAGSMSLYDAVKLAAKQPLQVGYDNARLGSEYYLFGAPNSAACATAAKDVGTAAVPGAHCLLSGPAPIISDLDTGVPRGVNASQGQLLVIKQGTIVLQAAPLTGSSQLASGAPTAQYYVLKDHVALFGNDITNPQQSTDQTGSPDVTFSFTSNGANAFQQVTSTIAYRGALVSGVGNTFNQHFAVALDTILITVPSIDYKTYPNGIPGTSGADITGGFTIQSARDLATQLRLGALPIHLRLISATRLSARR
jgi:SecD/SecF fusion protein